MNKSFKIDVNSPEFKAITAVAAETDVFVQYIQSLDSALTKPEATAIAATVIGSLPNLFKHDRSLHQYLLYAIAEIKNSNRRKN